MSEFVGLGGGAVVAAGWAGRKLLGPLFDEIAEDWRQRYSEHRTQNLNRIGQNAQAKLADRIESPGEVPPRVALRVMEEGSWCEAPVMAEYFGGILAASRNTNGDDRGVSWAGLVSRLSTPDVLLHYLLYEGFRRVNLGFEINLGESDDRQRARTYFPATGLLFAMGLPHTDEGWLIVDQSLNALLREDLLDRSKYHYGSGDYLRGKAPGADDDGALPIPSPAGTELFLWAHGHSDKHINSFLGSEVAFEAVENLPAVEGVMTTAALRQRQQEQQHSAASTPDISAESG